MKKNGSAPVGNSGRVAGLTLFACFAACLIAGLALLGSCSSDSSVPEFPPEPEPTVQHWLFDVQGTAADNVYACGTKGAMFRFDGTNWGPVDMGSSDPIVRMWKEDAGNTLYAVGHQGRIWNNTAGAWSAMQSGTTENLYGIGALGGVVHAVGQHGTIRRLAGSSWTTVAGRMFLLNEVGVALDTLQVTEDVASLVTVNHYFLGGAYNNPLYTGPRIGVLGTNGMVLAPAPETLPGDWILRPISGEQIVPHEWVLCTTSDSVARSRNYLGTSEGWLFRLILDDDGKNVWQKFFPSVTTDIGAGINDIWLDTAGNIYMVTDEGDVVFQTVDYKFSPSAGKRVVLFNGLRRLTGIWGTGPDNLWVTGFMDDEIMHGVHNQVTDSFTVTMSPVTFPAKASAPNSGLDHLDRPLR